MKRRGFLGALTGVGAVLLSGLPKVTAAASPTRSDDLEHPAVYPDGIPELAYPDGVARIEEEPLEFSHRILTRSIGGRAVVCSASLAWVPIVPGTLTVECHGIACVDEVTDDGVGLLRRNGAVIGQVDYQFGHAHFYVPVPDGVVSRASYSYDLGYKAWRNEMRAIVEDEHSWLNR